jgi:hypothetical protein
VRFYKERIGKLTANGTDYDIPLASWRPTPYRPEYRLVSPQLQDIPGSDGKVSGDPNIRYWHIDRFSGGEGEDIWEAGSKKFHSSLNVRPHSIEERLILGAGQSTTQLTGPAAFTEGGRFGIAQGKLWTVKDGSAHSWDAANGVWAAGWTTGMGTTKATSIVDADDGTNLYIGAADKKVYKVASGGNSVHYNTSTGDDFTYDPILRMWDGNLFALDGDSLYEITAADTRSLEVQVAGRSADYLSGTDPASQTYVPYNRLTTSDKGPVWFARNDNGQTILWEYNVGSDTGSKIGKLPVDQAMPYSIGWANGFVFVGFRFAEYHSAAGDAYLYYQRGSQRGVAGPFRAPSGSTASKPVLIGGVIGDDIIVYFDGAMWAYNVSAGGISMLADSATTNKSAPTEAITFGKDAFLGNINATGAVERFDTETYTTRTATWTSGRYDFAYPGVSKALLDVKVVTEPLPTGTTISLAVSADGASFSNVTGTFTGDGSTTSYTWTVSTHAATVAGRDFELRLTLSTTDSAKTPEVRSITARAVSVERQRSWILEVDAGDVRTLEDLAVLGAYDGPVKFTNVWDGREHDDPSAYQVMLTDMILVEAEAEGDGDYAALRLREVGYV